VQILALTFSKEAAMYMREKLEKLLQGTEIQFKTFHSFCSELIKDHAERCKVPGDFKIFEEMDSAIFIFRELGTDARTASLYANTIGKAKYLNISIDKYEEKKSAIGALDYGDLNKIALWYLDVYGTQGLNNTFHYIIIDEFQATNKILRVAHTLIEKNYGEEKRQECLLLKNHNDIEGENVSIIETEDDNEEARAIVEKIEDYLAQGITPKDIQYKVRRLTLEQLGLPNPRTFELIDGNFESAGGSRMEGLDETAVEDMIEIAHKIAHDYEYGFRRTNDEKVCGECGYGLYCGE
jgi:superfamily I DNA/RNA helicase